MTYVVWYFAIGAAMLVTILITGHLTRRKSASTAPDILEHLERTSWKFDKIVMPLVVVAVWPFVVGVLVHGFIESREELEPAKEFFVAPADLLQKIDVEEIERRERVFDPLNAVPDAPFGHLNAAWRKFLERANWPDSLWTFSTQWTTSWGRKELRAGYVVVRESTDIGAHFLTTLQKVE